MAAKYRKKVCRECGSVYYRRFQRNAGTEGWCGGNGYMRDYRRLPANPGGEVGKRRAPGDRVGPST